MAALAEFVSQHGCKTTVEFERNSVAAMASSSRIDAYIVSTEEGFSPLGSNLEFLSSDLGIPRDEIKQLADWNRFKNPLVSLIAIKSRRSTSKLRGIILAAAGSSKCYAQFAVHRYGRPYRDFYYNVTFESVAYACKHFGAKKLAISHLSGSGAFHQDIAKCNVESLAQFCNSDPSASVETFMFLGCCMSLEHFSTVSDGLKEGNTLQHREIRVSVEHRNGTEFIHLDWTKSS